MNRTLMLALLTLCCACGDTAEEETQFDVTLSSFAEGEQIGIPQLSFTVKNSGTVNLDTISVQFNLLRDQVIIGSASGVYSSGLRPGQAALMTALLGTLRSHAEYDCFESTIRLSSVQIRRVKTIQGPTSCN